MTRFALVLALVGSACATTAAAPTPAPTSPATGATAERAVAGGVLLVRTPRHVRVALDTVDALRAQDPRFQRFQVLVCGEAVKALSAGGELEPRLRAARDAGISVAACGLSLSELGVDPASLTQLVELVPNALIEVMRLQADGWISVEL